MNYDEAIVLAMDVKRILDPLCNQCQVAGSIRRKKSFDIKDVEIVAVPNIAHIHEFMKVVNGHWGPPMVGKFPSKYTRIRGLVNLDLFWCDKETFGLNFFIRTGSAEYVMRALAHWKKITKGGYSKDARLHRANGEIVSTPTEEAVFTALQCAYMPPEKRI